MVIFFHKTGQKVSSALLCFICYIVLLLCSHHQAVAQRVNVPTGHVGIRDLFGRIEEQTGFTFIYTRTMSGMNQSVTLTKSTYQLDDLLHELSLRAGLSFQRDKEKIIVKEQEQKGKVKGRIVFDDDIPVAGASVHIETFQTITDRDGQYQFDHIPVGNYQIAVSHLGTEDQYRQIRITADKVSTVDFTLTSKALMVEETIVVGRSALRDVKEQAYNVDALDAKSLHHTSLNLASALNRVSGVRVRSSGGLGSEANFSMNGFAGSHIRFFIDGVPLEVFGSTYQINNIPIEMAERIELYKGVAPVSLSSDALGGVVNIVTPDRKTSYLDASYSYGSFNTHRTFINAGYRSPGGFSAVINAYQNYSNNNYYVDVEVVDVNTGKYIPGIQHVRRFHDDYRNETLIAKVGLVDRSFADELYVGVNIGQEFQDSQTGTQMQYVYGERERNTKTFTPFMTYTKEDLFENLDIRATANYNLGYYQFIDTAKMRYNWLGESASRTTPGEYFYSSAKYYNRDGSATVNADYQIGNHHYLSISHVLTFFNRTATDPYDYSLESHMLEAAKKSTKNISGLSYRYVHNEDWNTSVFVKNYLQVNEGPINTSTGRERSYEMRDQDYAHVGYGFASTYFWKRLQFKGSYEKTYRLPTADELFGNESYNAGNIYLRPESSHNYNVNIIADASIDEQHLMEISVGLLYRNTQDYIIRSIGTSDAENAPYISAANNGQLPASYANHGLVHNKGISTDIKYYYQKWFSLGGNFTYQDLVFKNKYDPGDSGEKISLSYNTRVPNVPYLYGNGYVNVSFPKISKLLGIGAGYNTMYVHEFPLHTYFKNTQNVAMIPTQFTHNAFVSFEVSKWKTKLTLEAWNIGDEKVFDNYNLQNPGRNFSAKVRYSFSK